MEITRNVVKVFVFIVIVIYSCSKDTEQQEENNTGSETPESPVTATEECLISDFNIQENSTITVDCLLDLEGQTIEVPNNVTFEFDGGDVFNGTLNFVSSGKIDGELLSSALTLEGDVQLTSDTLSLIHI